MNMFLKELVDTRATHAAVAFDMRAKTFRHKMFEGYKAKRHAMPDDLAAQLFDLKDLLIVMGIKIFEKSGFEADDIIGTLSRLSNEQGYECAILTGDRDLLQLVNEKTQVILQKVGVSKIELFNLEKFKNEYGVEPKQLPDIKALWGDQSDNIPGIPGIGEKTAIKLVKEYGVVENLPEKYEKDREHIALCKTLATIKCDVEGVAFNPDELAFTLPFDKPVYDAFKSRAFHSICLRPELFKNTGVPQQMRLF
jgi:DNA polymerase-1